MIESTKHDAIYLQVCDDEDSEWCGEITWCQDRIHDEDVKYIRADLVESLRQQIASRDAEVSTLREQVKLLRDALDGARMVLAYEGIWSTVTICEKALAATEPKP